MLLAPPAAIRAPDLLARHLLENFHPLAVVPVLCSPGRFQSVARQALLDLRYPLLPVCPTNEPEPMATEQWFRAARQEAAEQFVQRAGLKREELTAMPGPTEPANQPCCPRCGGNSSGAQERVWTAADGRSSRSSKLLRLEVFPRLATLVPCRSTNFIVTNATRTAKSSCGPLTGTELNVRTAARRGCRRNCLSSRPVLQGTPRSLSAPASRVRAGCAALARRTRTEPL